MMFQFWGLLDDKKFAVWQLLWQLALSSISFEYMYLGLRAASRISGQFQWFIKKSETSCIFYNFIPLWYKFTIFYPIVNFMYYIEFTDLLMDAE